MPIQAGVIAASRPTPDSTAPSAPGTLSYSLLCQTTVTLSWGAATDNVGVTGYEIFKDNSLYQDVGNVLTKNITGLTTGSTAVWKVRAYDAAGNKGSFSNILSITQGVSVTSTTISGDGWASDVDACADTINYTVYITGGDSTPSGGEIIYTDLCGTTPLTGGGLYWSDGFLVFQVSNTGVISNLNLCT